MNLSQVLNDIAAEAFEKAGFDPSYGKVSVSNRPDLCEYQCNGAMAAAKAYKTKPIDIANAVTAVLKENPAFSMAEAVMPGFINLNVSEAFLVDCVAQMACDGKFGTELPEKEMIVLDYGGPNVAKPLHIGHLRAAIIGESIKRILRYMGHDVIGDIHLGDWGLQFGLIIEGLKEKYPELPYWNPQYAGDYSEVTAPFTISELEQIYPAASARSKEDADFLARAHENTFKLQSYDKAFIAVWKQIVACSVADMKVNYKNLSVDFDLWKGESDAQPYIPQLIKTLDDQKLSYMSDGAVVVDVQEETDKIEIPPCLITKSDGAALYQTTDLATIIMRMQDYNPDEIIYVTDKRQNLHFTQVFRVAKKAHLTNEDTNLVHIGYGTMNGKDGKPFKTRAGGVMRLEALIAEVKDAVRDKMKERYDEIDEDTVSKVSLAAIKYGDLSNQAVKDYNFDIDRFASFEGNTGPYILYTIVRIKSILRKAEASGLDAEAIKNLPEGIPALKALLRAVTSFPVVVGDAYKELAPHKLCGYIYQLSDAFNGFYHEVQILKEENETVKNSYLSLLAMTQEILETCIDLLGFAAPEVM